MSVNQDVVDKRIVPDGITSVIDCLGLMVFSADDVRVQQFDAGGGEVSIPDYTVSGLGDPAGITVTAAAPFAADPFGVVVVARTTAPLQQVEVEDFRASDSKVLEAVWDRLTLLAQESRHRGRRSIRLHMMDDGELDTLPPLKSMLGKVLAISPTGQLTSLSNVPLDPAVPVSGFMQGILQEGTDAAVLAALGFSGYMVSVRNAANVGALRVALGLDYALAADVLAGVSAAQAMTPASALGLFQTGTAIASAANLNLGLGTPGFQRQLTGVTAVGTITGTQPWVRLEAAADGCTLTHDPVKLVSRTASDIVMRAGDAVTLLRIGANQWKEIGFHPVPNWKSAPFVLANPGLVTAPAPINHYLGNRVGRVRLMATCIANDNGWTPAQFANGEALEVMSSGVSGYGYHFLKSATQIKLVIASGGLVLVHPTNGTEIAMTIANWTYWLEIDARG